MAEPIDTAESFEKVEDAGPGDKGLVRLWLAALEVADKEEKSWRTEAGETMKRYRQEELSSAGAELDRFNILFSSVETTVPALYNSVPVPDVRRRFNDKDPTAKFGAQMIERSLSYMVDSYDFDDVMEMAVQDSEITGRGVTRVRYVPYSRSDEETGENVVWQEVVCEHVQWANFRRGPGRTWDEVPWVAFELFWTRAQLDKTVKPAVSKQIKLDVTVTEDDNSENGSPPPEIFRRLRVWEIWDKDTREVLFIAPAYKEAPLKVEEDPYGLMGFLPVPPPLYSIRTSDSLVPIPPYRMFRYQAEELDRVTRRIMILVQCLKWRGIRDSTIPELENLSMAADGEMVAMQDAQALYAQAGGLEKAIWMYPIDKLISTIRELSVHREEIKQVIFEITGIADIMRGQTDPRETKGAQQIKTQWGSLRIQRRQAKVARHARDLFRLKSEIISNKFSPETLTMMSSVELASDQDKADAQQMMQQQRPPPQPGQQMPMQQGPAGPFSMMGPA